MEKIRLGKTGLMVSQLGLGGIPIQRLSEEKALAVVRKCLDLGMNFIDTADNYGKSEEYIGKAISGRSEKPIISTKTDYGKDVESQINQSLHRLGVESIDLYLFHGVSNFDTFQKVTTPDGPISVVRKAIKAGKVKHVGISSHSMEVAKEAVKSGIFEAIMFPFNFVTCEAADELLPLARANDVGFIAMKPLNAGMIKNIALAFKYLRRFPDIIAIPGIGKIKEINEIIQLYQGSMNMTEVEEREMLQLKDKLGKRFCRRCGDCGDICPEGIRVAFIMDSPGFLEAMDPEVKFSDRFITEIDRVATCTRCGECEERCPYGLPVMELIKEYADLYQSERRKYLASRK
jgi:predicted aldo/keto reductase-like oxidoreductase